MEQNLPIVAKKFWSTIRVIYLMLRKGITSKNKLLTDLNTVMKRGKIAGKAAMHSLMMFHHHSSAAGRRPLDEYEFSCSNSPAPFFHVISKRGKRSHAPPPELVAAALEMMVGGSAAASPALPGFGRTPAVRQLRITDSPFPLMEAAEEGNDRVDEAAEEFIVRFYRDLMRQNEMVHLGYS